MAVCGACGEKMSTEACAGRDTTVTRYGSDLPGAGRLLKLPRRCRDCRVRLGERHHVWCCVAGCVTHDYEQRMMCGCDE